MLIHLFWHPMMTQRQLIPPFVMDALRWPSTATASIEPYSLTFRSSAAMITTEVVPSPTSRSCSSASSTRTCPKWFPWEPQYLQKNYLTL
jgi:hypothetical protein